jgi:hypothetical protein
MRQKKSEFFDKLFVIGFLVALKRISIASDQEAEGVWILYAKSNPRS